MHKHRRLGWCELFREPFRPPWQPHQCQLPKKGNRKNASCPKTKCRRCSSNSGLACLTAPRRHRQHHGRQTSVIRPPWQPQKCQLPCTSRSCQAPASGNCKNAGCPGQLVHSWHRRRDFRPRTSFPSCPFRVSLLHDLGDMIQAAIQFTVICFHGLPQIVQSAGQLVLCSSDPCEVSTQPLQPLHEFKHTMDGGTQSANLFGQYLDFK